MKIYISCDNGNEFFLAAVKESRERVASSLSSKSIELVYPPMGWGGDTGKILTNVLQIMDADLVLIDITPLVRTLAGESPLKITKYNEGVLIEYGIVLCLDNPRQGSLPWGGRIPKPSYRIFCSNSFSRSDLTPIVNVESVAEYGTDSNSRELFVTLLCDEIRRKVEEKLTVDYNRSTL